MTEPTREPTPPAEGHRAPAVRTCVCCGADLVGVAVEDPCPSCGTPVLVSFRLRTPYGEDERSRTSAKIRAYGMMYAGLGCLLVGWLPGLFIVVGAGYPDMGVALVALTLFLASVVLIAESPPRARVSASQKIAWVALLIGATLSFGLVLFQTG